MRRTLTRAGTVAAAFAFFFTAAPVQTQTWDKQVYLKFSGAVQIPRATLPAGTYSFRLGDPNSTRGVMQVFSRDNSRLFGTFITMPVLRRQVTDDPVVTFNETPAGTTPALRALFYPGEHTGFQFVYPKAQLNPPAQLLGPVTSGSGAGLIPTSLD